MGADLGVLEGPYLRDLLHQPQALAETATQLNESPALEKLANQFHRKEFRSVVLTGMGSSFHALHSLQNALIAWGTTAVMVETSELVHYQSRLLGPSTLLVAVSQSGQSAEIIRLLKMHRKRSRLIGVTNTPNSPLARHSDGVLVTRAGAEYSVSCKTYVSALLALGWLADLLAGRNLRTSQKELAGAASLADSYLKSWRSHTDEFGSVLDGVRNLFLAGRGVSLSAVGTGGLIVKESSQVPAEGMSSAAFRHGPLEMVSERTFVLVFEGDPKTRKLNRQLFKDIRDHGGKAELVARQSAFAPCALPVAPAAVQPILEILPVQMMTLALGVQAGREPGRFSRATKITTKE